MCFPTVCPPNITNFTQYGRCDALLDYPSPNATDNCGTVYIFDSSSYPSRVYPKGVSHDVWVAFDAMPGSSPYVNSAQCTVYITVIDNQPPTLCKLGRRSYLKICGDISLLGHAIGSLCYHFSHMHSYLLTLLFFSNG